MKKRYFIELSYNGKEYHGWQIQENAVSVQGELNKALKTLLKEEVETTGCGRTDTGVHATQFFVHFDGNLASLKDNRNLSATEEQICENLVYHLNQILPWDIAIKRVFPVSENAHARFDATSRTYEYHIHRKKDPFATNRSCFVYGDLDIEKMNAAAQILYEYEDFTCFSKSNTQVFTNNCKIMRAEWVEKGNNLVFHITANRFLRNMVRAIVGTLLEIGRGKLQKEDLHTIIQGKKRSSAGTSVPAEGLYLVEVRYPF